jgi:hypothetical protein
MYAAYRFILMLLVLFQKFLLAEKFPQAIITVLDVPEVVKQKFSERNANGTLHSYLKKKNCDLAIYLASFTPNVTPHHICPFMAYAVFVHAEGLQLPLLPLQTFIAKSEILFLKAMYSRHMKPWTASQMWFFKIKD